MMEDESAKVMTDLIGKMMAEAIMGPPTPNRPTVLRYVGGRFESREIDETGNIVEPPPRCCYGTVLHAPNCKMWGNFT